MPDANKSNSPSKNPLSDPVIKLETQCYSEPQGFLGSNAFIVPCKFVVVPGDIPGTCVRELKLKYSILNFAREDIKIQGLIVGQGGKFTELIEEDEILLIRPGVEHVIEYYIKTNVCDGEVGELINNAVFGLGVTSKIPVSARGDFELPFL
jgi:hypothetical protein